MNISIKILLADDHKIMRQGLRSLLEKEQEFTVVGEASDGRDALKMVQRLKPGVVIMDVTMPGLNGIEATQRICKDSPEVKVVALTVHSDKNYLSAMLAAGASGYLLKDCAAEELVLAVRTVASGKAYISPEVTSTILEDYVARAAPAGSALSLHQSASGLSSREREILQMIAEGVQVKEIARRLKVSLKTVDRARSQIMEKLQFFSIAELTKYAVRQGLTPPE